MSTNAAVSAISHPEGWHAIQWRHHHRQVRKLQVRIAKATSDKQWRRVKSLQRMLVHSFSAKALAVKRVTENPGRRTPGIDRQTWSTPESKWKAIFQLSRTGYKPLPLRRIYIPKSNGKSRPLGIPAMRDRAMQALWLLALDPVAESTSPTGQSTVLANCYPGASRRQLNNIYSLIRPSVYGCNAEVGGKTLRRQVAGHTGAMADGYRFSVCRACSPEN